MLRLFVLLTAVVCCNAYCKVETFSTEDTTSSAEGCADSEGNLHEFKSEWENGYEICVCVENVGTICCERFGGHFGVTDHDYIHEDDEQFGGHFGVTDHDYIHEGDERHDHGDTNDPPNSDDHVAENISQVPFVGGKK